MSLHGDYYDGQSAAAHHATLGVQGDSLLIRPGRMDAIRWPFAELKVPAKAAKPYLLQREPDTGERLYIEDQNLIDVLHPLVRGAGAGHRRRVRNRWITACVGIWGLVALLWFGAGHAGKLLVPLVPRSVDALLQENALKQIQIVMPTLESAHSQQGSEVLQGLVERMRPPNDTIPYKVIVVQSRMVNAFALPNGGILLTSALLRDLENSDELAAILAHEMSHARLRHSTRLILAGSGLQFLGTLLGASPGNKGSELFAFFMSSAWSREMEAEADAGMLESLRASGIRPDGIVTFFTRLTRKPYSFDIPAIFSTHPHLDERIAKAGAVSAYPVQPALSPAAWSLVKNLIVQRL